MQSVPSSVNVDGRTDPPTNRNKSIKMSIKKGKSVVKSKAVLVLNSFPIAISSLSCPFLPQSAQLVQLLQQKLVS